MTAPAESLLAELAEATIGLRISPRLRLAVTPSEHIAIRAHLLRREGRFYGRVRNVPLVVDDNAAKPPFHLELAIEETAVSDQLKQTLPVED
jgi:hypothetical protein